MTTVHNLAQIADSWRALDPDNVTSETILAELDPLNVDYILGASKLDSRYFAILWKDSDADLQLGVYDRTGESFDYVEVSNNASGRDARIERVSSTEMLIYYRDATAADWRLALYSHVGGTVALTPDDTLDVGAVVAAGDALSDMCVLTSSLAMISYPSSSGPANVTFETVSISSGALAVVASSAAVSADVTSASNVAVSVSLARVSDSQAVIYWARTTGGASRRASIASAGTPITFGAEAGLDSNSGALYANIFPAVSDDGTFAIYPVQQDTPLASTDGSVVGAAISGSTISANSQSPSVTSPNLPNSDASSSTGAMAATCCYLAKEGDFHVGAVMGNYKDPLKNAIWGLIVAFKNNSTMSLGGSFHLPSTAVNGIPFIFRQDSNTLTAVYKDSSSNPAFIDVTRSPL